MIANASAKPVLADTDLLPEEIKALAAEHIASREGVARTLARVAPDGVYTDDVAGAIPRARRFRIAVELPRYVRAWSQDLGDLGLGDLDASIEGDRLILDYGVEQR